MPIITNPNIVGSEYLMDLSRPAQCLDYFIVLLAKYGGQFGNTIFLVCSSWFLCEGNGKTYYKKIVNLVVDTIAIYWLFLIVFLFAGYHISFKDIISCIMPVWFGSSWFVTCFVVFLLFVPILSSAVEHLEMKTLRGYTVLLTFIYCGLQFLRKGSFDYSHLIGFITIFFITAYIKKSGAIEKKSFGVIPFVIYSCLSIILVYVTNHICLRYGLNLDMLRWCRFVNPLFVMSAVSLLKAASGKQFHSMLINNIASLSLLIYLIHNNKLVENYMVAEIWNWTYSSFGFKNVLVKFIVIALCFSFASLIIATIYKIVISPITKKISIYLYQKVRDILE